MTVLYDYKGDPIDFNMAAPRDLAAEFATRLTAGADVLSFLSWLPDPDPVLRKRGDGSDVLSDLTADDQVCMAMQSRKLRVLNEQSYDFSPGQAKGKEPTPQASRLCDALAGDMESIRLRDVFSCVLDAPFYGFVPLELLWRPEGGRYRLADIVAKPQHWFAFDDNNRPVFRGEVWAHSAPLPRYKFVLARHFPTYENPYGLRLLSRCLWPVAFKRGGIEFLTRFLEKYGMPWILATAARGADRAERQRMAGDLAAMVQDAVAVLPNGAEAELVTASGKSGDQHENYLRRWDKAISKVLMGQTLTAEMDGTGSRAAAETHYGVSEDMADADKFLVADAMNQVGLIYRDVNAEPGVMAPVFGYEEPEDFVAQADLDTKLHGVGVRFKKVHFTRRYGLDEDEFDLTEDAAPEADPEPGAPFLPAEFAQGDDSAQLDGDDSAQADIDRAVEEILGEAVAANQKLIQDITMAVNRAETPADAMLLLSELLAGESDTSEVEDLLARIMVNAELRGRAAVREEDGE